MRTGVHMVEESAQVPDSFESFEEYRAFLLEYRDLLSRMVKLTASLLPEPALQVLVRWPLLSSQVHCHVTEVSSAATPLDY